MVVIDFKIWRHYIDVNKSEDFTDYRSLHHIFTKKDLNMRQWSLLELLKDCGVNIKYNFCKANVVADSLSRKWVSMGSLYYISVANRPLSKEIQALESNFM